jgi:hypothetical protein
MPELPQSRNGCGVGQGSPTLALQGLGLMAQTTNGPGWLGLQRRLRWVPARGADSVPGRTVTTIGQVIRPKIAIASHIHTFTLPRTEQFKSATVPHLHVHTFTLP